VTGKFSLEKILRVYDDKNGEFIEVREDRDSLGLIEIVQDNRTVTMSAEQAVLVSEALDEVIDFINKKQEEEG
jgi:hypothetical protein